MILGTKGILCMYLFARLISFFTKTLIPILRSNRERKLKIKKIKDLKIHNIFKDESLK